MQGASELQEFALERRFGGSGYMAVKRFHLKAVSFERGPRAPSWLVMVVSWSSGRLRLPVWCRHVLLVSCFVGVEGRSPPWSWGSLVSPRRVSFDARVSVAA